MKCKKIKILLSAYIDRELTRKAEELVNEHLKTCQGCFHELDYLKQTKKLFSYKEKVEPLSFFETRLLNRVREKMPVVSMPEEFIYIARRAMFVSFSVLLIVLGIFMIKTFFTEKVQIYQLIEDSLYQNDLSLTERKVFIEPEISENELIALVIYNQNQGGEIK